MGFFIDVIIAWLIKLALRLRRAWGSGRWERVKARVDSSSLEGGWVMNCPTVEIAYTYEFRGETYSAIDTSPFLTETFAKERVERFKAGETAVVRVNPKKPQRSVLSVADQ